MYYTYILKSLKDGKKYIGHTSDIQKRLKEHNSGECKATIYRRPFELIHYEEFDKRIHAINRELFYKSGHGRDYMKKVLNF